MSEAHERLKAFHPLIIFLLICLALELATCVAAEKVYRISRAAAAETTE